MKFKYSSAFLFISIYTVGCMNLAKREPSSVKRGEDNPPLTDYTSVNCEAKNTSRSLANAQNFAPEPRNRDLFKNYAYFQSQNLVSEAQNSNLSEKYFYSAEVYTARTFQYGKFVARMKPVASRGTVSAFFLYSTETQEEFDIEILGGSKTIVPVVHPCKAFKTINMNATYFNEFHNYSIEWRPRLVTWYMDDIKILEVKVSDYSAAKRIMLSSNVHKKWDGDVDLTKWKEHKISYSSLSYFPYIENEEDFSAVPEWRDNFENPLDPTIWVKTQAAGGSPENYTLYNPKNVVQSVSNGVGQLDILLTRMQ